MADSNTIATAYVQLVPTLSGVQGAVGTALGGPEVTQEAEKAGKSMGGSLLAGLKAVAGPSAIAGVLGGLFAVGSTFDDVSDSIRTATGKTGADLDALVQNAKNVGTTVPVEFDKIGPALSTVQQKLGLAGSDLETVTSQFLALGNVTGKEINIEQTTAAFSAFGIKGGEVSGQLDTLLKISQATGTGIDEITASVQKSAPALQGLGFSFQDSAALVGQLDKAGLNVQATLGGMGKALITAAKDGEQPEETFKRVTSGIGDLVAQGKDAEAISLASSLFGTKGASQFVEATKAGALNVADLTAAVDANGETILGAQEDTADFAESWTIFKNKAMVAIEPVATAVFNFAGQAMGALADAFENIVEVVKTAWDWIVQYKDVLIAAGVVVLALTADLILQEAAIIAQTVASKAATIATNLWKAAQLALNIVLSANPIGLVVAAIAALVGAAIWAYQNVGWFRDIVDDAWKVISEAAQWAWEHVIKPVFDALSGAVSAVIDFFSNFGDNVQSLFNNIGGWISGAWNSVLTFFSELPGKAWGKIVEFANFIGEKGAEFVGWLKDGIVNGAQAIWDWFTALPVTIWNIFIGFETWLGDRIWEFIHWFSDGIADGAQAIWDWFTDLPGAIWDTIVSVVGATGQWLIDRGTELIHWLKDGFVAGATAIWDWFSNTNINDTNGLLGQIWGGIKGLGETILGFGSQIIDWIISGITGGAKAVLDAIGGLFSDLTFNPDGTISSSAGSVTANPLAPANARGGVIPGVDPGRRDNRWSLVRSEESIFVPEFTRAIGGAPTVNAWNRAAEAGRLGDYGFARGGVVAGDPLRAIGKGFTDKLAGDIATSESGFVENLFQQGVNVMKDLLASVWASLFGGMVAGGLNPSQDPSSFGWKRASNIVPFNWGGQTIGVAGGTEGLWRALLDALMPRVPGGLLSLGGYDNRNIAGTNTPSFHSYGLALDINAGQNYRGLPGYGRTGYGEIPGDIATKLAAQYGMEWGGNWGYTDPMHFEIHVSPDQIGSGGIVNRIVSGIFAEVTGQGVDRWRSTGLQALAMLGQPAALIGAVLSQIAFESSGNPRAINLTDANTRRGTPSKGLVQVIDPTFAAYGLPGYTSDIYDPLSNLLAGMRWAIASQGSIGAAWGHQRPYDNGGWLMPGIWPISMLREPEPVLAPAQWRIAEEAIAQVSGKAKGGNYTWNVYPQEGQPPSVIAAEMDRLLAFSVR